MVNKSHISELVERLDRIKQAADGSETSMPDDPSGDGTINPTTGSQFTQYSKDKDRIETVPPDADKQPSSSMREDHEQENSFSSYTLSTAGSSAQSAKGEYKDRPTDPGTSMPAEAGQEKYSSAINCTLEENIDIFQKCASSIWNTRQAYNDVMEQQVKQASYDANVLAQYPAGTFTKMAADMGANPDEINEVAAMEAIAQDNPELLSALDGMTPEELDELAAIAEAIDSEAGGSEEEIAPEEAAALEKQCFFQQDKAMQNTIASLDEGQLKQAAANLDYLLQKAAEDGLSEEEVAEILAPSDESSSDESDNGECSDSSCECKKEDEKDGGCCKKSTCKKGGYTMTAEELYKQASPQQLYYLALQKQAEDEQAAYESLSPEEQALLNSASDEELQNAVAEGEAAQEDPGLVDEMLSESPDGGSAEGEPSSDEALNELAAAMDEQGITPEVLEQASKEASVDPDLCKMAQAIIDYRKSGKYVYSQATTEKAAKLRSLSHKYLSEVFPRR